jgi:hypothetical protein
MVTTASDKVEARLNHSERIPRITQSKTQSGGNFGDKKKWDETEESSSKQKGVARSFEQRYCFVQNPFQFLAPMRACSHTHQLFATTASILPTILNLALKHRNHTQSNR